MVGAKKGGVRPFFFFFEDLTGNGKGGGSCFSRQLTLLGFTGEKGDGS